MKCLETLLRFLNKKEKMLQITWGNAYSQTTKKV